MYAYVHEDRILLISHYLTGTTKPMILQCPSDIHVSVDTRVSGTNISWSIPIAIDDLRGQLSVNASTHQPGQLFPIGATLVSYKFADSDGNFEFCNFSVIVNYSRSIIVIGLT